MSCGFHVLFSAIWSPENRLAAWCPPQVSKGKALSHGREWQFLFDFYMILLHGFFAAKRRLTPFCAFSCLFSLFYISKRQKKAKCFRPKAPFQVCPPILFDRVRPWPFQATTKSWRAKIATFGMYLSEWRPPSRCDHTLLLR